MPAVEITTDDLAAFAEIDSAKAEAMIEDALAMAELVAPCILLEDFAYAGAAKAILRGAILRWHDSGSGVVSSQTAGPFAQVVDTRQARRSMFWPSEIEQLQSLFRVSGKVRAFEVDLCPPGAGIPLEWGNSLFCEGWDLPPSV